MEIAEQCAQLIERVVRPLTFPFVVKMVRNHREIPRTAKRPKSDFGALLDACQAFALARREKLEVALVKEDMWCPEAVLGYGLAKPPSWFLEGRMWYPWAYDSLENGAELAKSLPRFEPGEYVGILVAPYERADFDPDLLIVYGNPGQMKVLADGMRFADGMGIGACHNDRCVGFGNAACVRAVVPAITTGRCQITLPCGGDHKYAGTQDDEMIFSVPKAAMRDLVYGLRRGAEEIGSVHYPWRFNILPEHEFQGTYMQLRKMLDMTEPLRGDCGRVPWYKFYQVSNGKD